MITTAILFIFLGILGYIFALLPVATIASIPIIGNSLSALLYDIVGVWNAFLVTFPYAEVGWTAFKWLIVFELGLLALKFFLGDRIPAHDMHSD